MPFISSILLLISIGCAVFIPILVGHVLAEHEYSKAAFGIIFAVLFTIFMWLHAKSVKSYDEKNPHHH